MLYLQQETRDAAPKCISGENQLSRSLIGLSPLPTAHPPSFQPRWVRASTKSYLRFTLAMGRSPASGPEVRLIAPIQTRFATASHHWLTSPHTANSQAHSSKARCHKDKSLLQRDCKQMVSGSISPSRGSFHLSLTVLVRYRSPRRFRLGGWSRRDSHEISRPRATWDIAREFVTFRLRGSYLYAYLFLHGLQLHHEFLTPFQNGSPERTIPQPHACNACGYHACVVWPVPRSLATTYGITIVVSSCGYLRCFTSPRSLHSPYVFRRG